MAPLEGGIAVTPGKTRLMTGRPHLADLLQCLHPVAWVVQPPKAIAIIHKV